jgi:hypothetical protein
VLLHALPLVFLLTGGAFALSAAAFAYVRLPGPAAATRPEDEEALGRVVAGFRFLFRENEGVLVALSLTVAGLTLLGGAYYALAAVLTQQTFHLGSQGIGFLEAVYGVGGLLGGLLVGLLTRGRRVTPLFMGGAALSSMAAGLFGVSPAGVWPFVCLALVGVADIVVQISATTILQAATPDELRGRAFSAFEATLVGAMVLGAVLAGPLLGLWGPRGATVAFALLGGVALLVCLPRLRRLDDVLGVRIFLRGVPLLAPLSRHRLDDVAARLRWEQVPAQAVIVREGEPGDRLYIVQEGEVEVVGRDARGQERVVAHQGKGSYFGEIALLRGGPRTATVRARGPVTLYSLSRADFQDLLRQVQEVRAMMADTAEARYQRYGQDRLPMRL